MISFFFILLLAFATGYISLSQEILWMRVVSYATGSMPDDFAYVLGFFLLGVAGGAYMSKHVSEKGNPHPITFMALMLFLSGTVYYCAIPASTLFFSMGTFIGMTSVFFLVMATAFLVGAIFPILCHMGIGTQERAGKPLSWIYLSNIMGSVAGPLVTGFLLMDMYELKNLILALSIALVIISVIVLLHAPESKRMKLAFSLAAVVLILGTIPVHQDFFSHVYEKLQYKRKWSQHEPYRYLVQNRHGVISVERGEPDIIYGGGVYDGMFNTDPVVNSNGIRRAYMIAALHPHPHDVLEIGLSSASWARVIANHAEVRRLTSIEINPGYLEVIRKYPEVASVLSDPRIEIHVDDGRRWLNRHPEVIADFIVMNTSFHWRSYTSNLLSADFFTLCKRHLKPAGVFYFNATGSNDAAYTAARVFLHVARYGNFVAASDTPFSMTQQEKVENLRKFVANGKLVFDPSDPNSERVLEEMVTTDVSDQAPLLREQTGPRLVTDDNMATEYPGWYRPAEAWRSRINHLF